MTAESTNGTEVMLANRKATGVREAAIATLFLRSTIVGSLRRNLAEHPEYLGPLMQSFADGKRLPLYDEKGLVTPLSVERRNDTYGRVRAIAQRREITVHVCACKNSDMPGESCEIAGSWNEVRSEGMLF